MWYLARTDVVRVPMLVLKPVKSFEFANAFQGMETVLNLVTCLQKQLNSKKNQ